MSPAGGGRPGPRVAYLAAFGLVVLLCACADPRLRTGVALARLGLLGLAGFAFPLLLSGPGAARRLPLLPGAVALGLFAVFTVNQLHPFTDTDAYGDVGMLPLFVHDHSPMSKWHLGVRALTGVYEGVAAVAQPGGEAGRLKLAGHVTAIFGALVNTAGIALLGLAYMRTRPLQTGPFKSTFVKSAAKPKLKPSRSFRGIPKRTPPP